MKMKETLKKAKKNLLIRALIPFVACGFFGCKPIQDSHISSPQKSDIEKVLSMKDAMKNQLAERDPLTEKIQFISLLSEIILES